LELYEIGGTYPIKGFSNPKRQDTWCTVTGFTFDKYSGAVVLQIDIPLHGSFACIDPSLPEDDWSPKKRRKWWFKRNRVKG
jgi:hypothetical protein